MKSNKPEVDENELKFQEKLKGIVALGRKKKNFLEYQEINDYFADMELNEEQINLIYDYLDNSGIDVLRENQSDDDIVLDDMDEVPDDEEDIDIENIDLSVPDGVSIEDPVRMYLKEIGKVQLLSADEEIDLAKVIELGLENKQNVVDLEKRIRKTENQEVKEELQAQLETLKAEVGDSITKGEAAKKRLAEANLRLVVSIAKRYVGRGMQFLDLIQEGNLGLIKAVEKFDYSKGYKFSTYATWWIRQAASRALADQARTIRIPVHMIETINKLMRRQKQLVQRLGREPTVRELAREMGIGEKEVVAVRKMAQRPISLQAHVSDDGESTYGDFIPDEKSANPREATDGAILRDQIREVLSSLGDREREVIDYRFGLTDGYSRTLEEVGEFFNVTRERVRQIEAKALRKLRHPSRMNVLREYFMKCA